MTSLLENLQKQNVDEIKAGMSGPTPTAVAAAPLSQAVTSSAMTDVAKQAQAGLGGKALPTISGPQTGSLLDQAAVQTAKLQDRTQQQQAQTVQADTDAKIQQQALQMTNSQLELRSRGLDMRQKMQTQLGSMLQEFEQRKTELETTKMKAAVEQASTLMRLSNDKYIYKLKAEGRKARLDKGIRFKEELSRTLWSEEMDLFNNDLGFRSLMKADERTFERKLSELNIDAAMKLAMGDIDYAQQLGKYSAIGTGISAATQAAVIGATAANTAPEVPGRPVETTQTTDLPQTYTTTPTTGVA